jgi:hypothetical protein
MAKQNAWVPKAAIEQRLLTQIERGHAAAAKRQPDLSFSAWQRRALLERASKDLGVPVSKLLAAKG